MMAFIQMTSLNGVVQNYLANQCPPNKKIPQGCLLNLRPGIRQVNQSHEIQKSVLQDLLQSLRSPVDDVRKDSAQALGALGAGRMEIMKPLVDLMINDSNYLVQYESAKSLITLGMWSKCLVDFIAYSLTNGPSVIQADLLELLSKRDDFVQLEEYADSYRRCVHITSEIVRINAGNGLSLLAAVVMSSMNHQYIHCQEAVISRLQAGLTDKISHNRSKALSLLVLKWNIKDNYVVEEALKQLCKMFEWTLRLAAIKVLLHIGKDDLLKLGETHVFNVLVDKLSSDPIQVVRFNVGKLITAIGLRIKALDLLLKQLNDHNDNVRTRAVMAMGNFELKGTKYMQGLLDLLELDANQNVRIQVLRVFGNLKFYEVRVIEKLLERDKGTGVIAKEAQKALRNLQKENIIKGYSN